MIVLIDTWWSFVALATVCLTVIVVSVLTKPK